MSLPKQGNVPELVAGTDGIIAAACHDDADTVVTGEPLFS